MSTVREEIQAEISRDKQIEADASEALRAILNHIPHLTPSQLSKLDMAAFTEVLERANKEFPVRPF